MFKVQFYDYNKPMELSSGGYFVFGSNEAGRHGKGAARTALLRYGAEYGVASGFTGQCYAIPTKDAYIRTLPLHRIETYVREFVNYVRLEALYTQENNWYLVTALGTGLAGYPHHLIAPMFKGALNCWFPDIWEPFLL